MPLTDAEIRKTPVTDRAQKLFDGGGLYLLIKPNGRRWWRLKFRVAGKEQLLSLGVYPEVTLKAARERRESLRKQLHSGVDPGVQRRVQKHTLAVAAAKSFEVIANEWLHLQRKRLAPATYSKNRWMLDSYLIPAFGRESIDDITAPQILAALRLIESKGVHETAHRCRALCSRIFRYAISTGRAERDPGADLRGALAPAVSTPRAAITDPERIGGLLRAIDGYLATLQQQLSAYDELAQRVNALRGTYTQLGDAQLQQIARTEQALEQARKREQEDKQRAREQQQQQSSSSSSSNGSGGSFVPSGKLLVEFAGRGVDADALIKDSVSMERLTREFAKRLEALAQRGGFNIGRR